MAQHSLGDARRQAAQLDMLIDHNKNHGPKYLVIRRGKTMHVANSIEDIIGWMAAWRKYAA